MAEDIIDIEVVMSHTDNNRLSQHNTTIHQRLKNIELLVELNDDKYFYDELRQLINERHAQGFSYQKIARNFPHVVSYVMVLHGIFHYDEGNYWHGLGLDQNQRQSWVEAFRTVCVSANLPLFDWIPNALTNVTPVLMHGGIPKSCLADYFNYFLQRFMRVSQRQNVNLEDYRDVWTEQDFPQVAKPVKRFISEGGDVALNWIQKSIDMAYEIHAFRRNANKQQLNDELLNAIQLPHWVVQEYWLHLTQKLNVEYGEVISPPRIHLYGEHIAIDLPSQTLELKHGDNVYWQLITDNQNVTVQLFYDYRDRFIETRHEAFYDILLDEMFGLTIVLMQGDRKVREWHFRRLALVFREHASGAVYYHKAKTLPNRAVYIASPVSQAVEVDGVPAETSLSTTSGQTHIYAVDVPSIQSVTVGGEVYVIQENDEDLRPHLDTQAHKLPLLQPQNAVPVYSEMPDIVIPLSRNSAADEQKANWRIQVTDVGNSFVCVPKQEIRDLSVGVLEMNAMSLMIRLRRLLSQLQSGTYRVELFGSRGRTVINFIYLPGLVVRKPNTFQHTMMGVNSVVQSVEFSHIPSGWCVESASIDASGCARVDFPAHVDSGQLTLRHSSVDQAISIDLVFPRLEVRIINSTGHTIAENKSIVKDRQWYMDAQPSIELVLMPINAPQIDNLSVSSSVYLDNGNDAQQLLVKSDSSKRWFRIDTTAAYDTINTAPGGNAQIAVQVSHGEIHERSLPVITIQKLVTLDNPRVQVDEVSTRYRFSMDWDTPRSPSNWRVVAWSISRPWTKPLTYPIPQDVTRFHCIVETKDMLPGESYLVGVMPIVRSDDATPKLPPTGEGLLLFQMPGQPQCHTVDDRIAQLFTGTQSERNEHLAYVADVLSKIGKDDVISICQHFLLHTHQWLLYVHGTPCFDEDWQKFIKIANSPHVKDVRNGMASYKTELFIAMMCVLRDIELIGMTSRHIFERMIHACFPALFEVLVKYDIRGSLVMMHVLAYQSRLDQRHIQLMQKYGVYVEDGIDELFVDVGVTDTNHWYGLPVHVVDDSIKSTLNNSNIAPIVYDDALIATGTNIIAASLYPDVQRAKQELIDLYKNRLFPSLMLWILRQAHMRKRLNTARMLSGWWYYRQFRVYELLSSYNVKQGGLREYIEAGMFRD